jgi:hypothetical protein
MNRSPIPRVRGASRRTRSPAHANAPTPRRPGHPQMNRSSSAPCAARRGGPQRDWFQTATVSCGVAAVRSVARATWLMDGNLVPVPSDEPQFISDDVIRELLNDSMRLTKCVNLRGHRRYCCSYHEGFEDALDIARQWMEHHA